MSYTIEPGIISEVKGAKARVQIGSGIVTDFLNCPQFANSFKRFFSPLRVGEQCFVLAVRDSINSGFVIRGAYFTKYPAPDTDEDTETTLYSDGTKISYNTKSKKFTANLAGDAQVAIEGSANIMIGGSANITVGGAANIKSESVNIDTKTASVKADTATITCPTTNITGNVTVSGVVTATGVVGTSVTVGGVGGAKLTSEGGKFKLDKPLDVTGNITSSATVSGVNITDQYGNVRTPYTPPSGGG
jgi:phage baseplate assembly protein V